MPKTPKYLFILEMANNHMGSVAHGKRIIHELQSACEGFGFDIAIKLQYRSLDHFIHPAYRGRSDLKFIKRFSETALTWQEYRELKESIVQAGFVAICTPWDEVSVDKITEHGFDYLKVPSCYLTDWPLAEKIVRTDLPLIISTAGESFAEIDRVVTFYSDRGKDLAVMHCVGEYPTAADRLQLNQIQMLKERYPSLKIGFSTHESPSELHSIRIAIAKGATIFEKHVGLETASIKLNPYSASPPQVRAWLQAASDTLATCGVTGTRYEFSEVETRTLGDLRRAVFARKDLNKGDVLRIEDLILAIPSVPGQIVANELSKYTEFRLSRDIEAMAAIGHADVVVTDTRSAVNSIVADIKGLLKDSKAIVPASFRLELSHHYGLEKFRQYGSGTITVVNNEYCKRIILILPGQCHPEQWHEQKNETFHILYGEIILRLDGKSRKVNTNEVITIPTGMRHAFSSTTGAVIEEISSNYSQDDSHYSDPSIRRNPARKTYVMNWMTK